MKFFFLVQDRFVAACFLFMILETRTLTLYFFKFVTSLSRALKTCPILPLESDLRGGQVGLKSALMSFVRSLYARIASSSLLKLRFLLCFRHFSVVFLLLLVLCFCGFLLYSSFLTPGHFNTFDRLGHLWIAEK